MKSFRELLGLGDDPLLKQADTLVHVAEINANSAFTPLLKKFSFLREVDVDCGRVRRGRSVGEFGFKRKSPTKTNGKGWREN